MLEQFTYATYSPCCILNMFFALSMILMLPSSFNLPISPVLNHPSSVKASALLGHTCYINLCLRCFWISIIAFCDSRTSNINLTSWWFVLKIEWVLWLDVFKLLKCNSFLGHQQVLFQHLGWEDPLCLLSDLLEVVSEDQRKHRRKYRTSSSCLSHSIAFHHRGTKATT